MHRYKSRYSGPINNNYRDPIATHKQVSGSKMFNEYGYIFDGGGVGLTDAIKEKVRQAAKIQKMITIVGGDQKIKESIEELKKNFSKDSLIDLFILILSNEEISNILDIDNTTIHSIEELKKLDENKIMELFSEGINQEKLEKLRAVIDKNKIDNVLFLIKMLVPVTRPIIFILQKARI